MLIGRRLNEYQTNYVARQGGLGRKHAGGFAVIASAFAPHI